MLHNQDNGFRRAVIQCLATSIALALVTFVCFRFQIDLAVTAALYLIVIVALSLRGSFVLSAVFSLVTVALLAYLFAPPIFDLRVTDPLNAVEIVAFLTTSAVITYLVSRSRKSAVKLENLTQELRHREASLAEAQRLSQTGSFGWRPSTGEIDWSEETFRIFQYDRTLTPTVERILQRVHQEDVDSVKRTIERASQDGKDFDHKYRLVMPNGSVKYIHVVAHAVSDESDGIEFVGAVMDVSGTRQSEDALREQAALLDLTRDTIFVRDVNDVITFWNRGAEEQYGWTKEEAVGRVSHDLMQTVFPAPLEAITAELLRAGRWEGELIHTRRDGTKVVVASRWSLQRDDQGRPAATLETNNDITARKQAEAEKEHLEAQLRQSQKMEAMGTLAGGIAHDFNNILGAILGYGELAQKNLAEGSIVRRHLDQVMQAGGRGKALVERILAFSRSGLGERVPLHVQSVIEETLDLLAASLPGVVRLDKQLEAGDAAVVGDATQLHQVVMNLCTNAMQAMEHGGVLTVTRGSHRGGRASLALARDAFTTPVRTARGERHGSRDPTGGAGADVRSVLHHQTGRRRHGPGAVAGPRHRRRPRWRDRRGDESRRRDHVRHLAARCRPSRQGPSPKPRAICRGETAKR